jgi:hypothetical protein
VIDSHSSRYGRDEWGTQSQEFNERPQTRATRQASESSRPLLAPRDIRVS